MRRLARPTLIMLCAALVIPLARAAGPAPILSALEREQLVLALRHLNATTNDLGFTKDVAEPILVLDRVRHMLESPLDLPTMADECLQAVQAGTSSACWLTAASWLELGPLPSVAPALCPTNAVAEASRPWAEAINIFYRDAFRAHQRLQTAYTALDEDQRKVLAASLLAGTFLIADDPVAYRAVEAVGLPSNVLSRILREADILDPRPAASNVLALIRAIDLGAVDTASQTLHAATDALRRNVATITQWPDAATNIPTPLGDIRIGTTGNDRHAGAALLILDPAGNDTYTGNAGRANGLAIPAAMAVIVDLTGDDQYGSEAVLGPGSALFGIALILDGAGNDTYRTAYTGLAAALFGAAALSDDAGNDVYQALALAQGAGYAGIGILRDRQGDDRYDLGYDGQAYAGVRGVGLLIDDAGNDVYTAGGKHPDHERYQERYLSTAQGFAIGMRPFAGGGVAALVDRAGNDTYVADVYGHGVGYWYSVGMLLDEGGHDSYRVHEYGQGAGIHLSLGLLSDRDGNDTYTGFSLSQGSAHDYAVGLLLDHAGNDLYAADHFSQGLAINNAVGILLDAGGNDGYCAPNTGQSQGIGNDGGDREYGSLALLLDLAGADHYSCGARDGARVLRPDYGMVYDLRD